MGKSRLSPARKAALVVLDEARRRDGYVRELLDRPQALSALDGRDAGLVRRLVLGATAARGCLDELLNRFLAKPNKVAPRVRLALRIAAFELLYLGTSPEVAVSQGVELARSVMPAASGLANAVLHKVAAAREDYLAAADADGPARSLVSAARRAGMPIWLAGEISASLGEQAALDLCAAELEPAPIAAHQGCTEHGPHGSVSEQDEACFSLPGCVAPVDMHGERVRGQLQRAEIVISDAHAQLIATAATRPGSCLEIGAGRGTKTYIMSSQAARAGYAREHVALDLYAGKCRQNLERLERAGIRGVRAVTGDARDLDAVLAPLDAEARMHRLFDTVFVDAPCSGTGTMRRHPEIPWRLAREDAAANLPELQLALLREAAMRVAAGGELLYATCSVLRQENEAVVDAFLETGEGEAFLLAPLSESGIFRETQFAPVAPTVRSLESERGLFQTVPAPGAFDGHFCARFIKRS